MKTVTGSFTNDQQETITDKGTAISLRLLLNWHGGYEAIGEGASFQY